MGARREASAGRLPQAPVARRQARARHGRVSQFTPPESSATAGRNRFIAVANKGYGNVSEYFRTLLREAQEKERDARLEVLLLEGLASGDPIPVNEEFWNKLKAESEKFIEKHANCKKRSRRST
jgi:antitoxin ParD1/3/4